MATASGPVLTPTVAEMVTGLRLVLRRQTFPAPLDQPYYSVRLYSSLGNVPPIEWELRFMHRQLQAA